MIRFNSQAPTKSHRLTCHTKVERQRTLARLCIFSSRHLARVGSFASSFLKMAEKFLIKNGKNRKAALSAANLSRSSIWRKQICQRDKTANRNVANEILYLNRTNDADLVVEVGPENPIFPFISSDSTRFSNVSTISNHDCSLLCCAGFRPRMFAFVSNSSLVRPLMES